MSENERNRRQRKAGMELVELTPIILGGSPTDVENKAFLTRRQHFEFVRYWNEVISRLRRE